MYDLFRVVASDVVSGLIFHSRLVYGKEKVRKNLTADVENGSLERADRKKIKEEVSYRDHRKRKYLSI